MQLKRFCNQEIVTLNVNTKLGQGGEGSIYTVLEETSLVAKIYDVKNLTTTTVDKLKVMVLNNPFKTVEKNIPIICTWPVDLLVDTSGSQQIVGFLMQKVEGRHPIHEFYDPGSRYKISPLFNYLYLHQTAERLASVISKLHNHGYIIGDVNESNILVSETADVTIVDTDSFQVCNSVNNIVYRCPVGTLEFTPPELQGWKFSNINRRSEHDLFGLGVLIFKLLMEGTHPFDGIFTRSGEAPSIHLRIKEGHFPYGKKSVPYHPKPFAPAFNILHPELQRLCRCCFEEGHNIPINRPSAEEWLLMLKKAKKDLVICSKNDEHRYGSHLRTCPWCELKVLLQGSDPFPSSAAIASASSQKLLLSTPTPAPTLTPPTPTPTLTPPTPTPRPAPTPAPTPRLFISSVCFLIGLLIFIVTPHLMGLQDLKRISEHKFQSRYEYCIDQVKRFDRERKLLPFIHASAQKLLSECQVELDAGRTLLKNAQTMLDQGNYINAIVEANKINKENFKLHSDAEALIQLSTSKIILLADKEYQKGDLQSAILQLQTAITQVKKVSNPNKSFSTEVSLLYLSNAVNQWKGDWDLASKLFDEAQIASEGQNWQNLMQIIEKLPNIQYWQYKIEPIKKIAVSKITENEILNGKLMVIDKSRKWENLDPGFSEKYWSHTAWKWENLDPGFSEKYWSHTAWKFVYNLSKNEIERRYYVSYPNMKKIQKRKAIWCWYVYKSDGVKGFKLICDGKSEKQLQVQAKGMRFDANDIDTPPFIYAGDYDEKENPIINYAGENTTPCTYKEGGYTPRYPSMLPPNPPQVVNYCIPFISDNSLGSQRWREKGGPPFPIP